MTINEAIKHAEETAEEQDMKAGFETDYPCYQMSDTERNQYKVCAEEHRQLAEWLKHYKKFRECMSMYYNGKIDKDKCFEMLTDMFTENGRRKEEE